MKKSLPETHPEIAKEWSCKNHPLMPECTTYGSNKVFWWKGACGHEWQASVKARTKGEGCPICKGIRVLKGYNDLSTLRPDLAAEWSERNYPLKPEDVTLGSHNKVWWEGKCGHIWEAEIRSRVKGSGCPFCSSNKVLSGYNDLKTLFPEIAKEWSDRNLPLMPEKVSPYSNRKVWWKCEHGHEWHSHISTRTGKGSKCPYCSNQEVLKGFNDVKTLFPQLEKEWSEKNLPFTLDMYLPTSRTIFYWICSLCGYEWKSTISSRTAGVNCPVCKGLRVEKGINDLMTTNKELALEWDYEKNKGLKPEDISRLYRKKVWWKCSQGHSFRARICDRANGEGCILCEKEFRSALPKLLVAYYGLKLGFDVKYDDEEAMGLKLDAFVPEIGLAIDFWKETESKINIKSHIAEKSLKYVVVLKAGEEKYYVNGIYMEGDDSVSMAKAVKEAYLRANIVINSNTEEDVRVIRNQYELWKKK